MYKKKNLSTTTKEKADSYRELWSIFKRRVAQWRWTLHPKQQIQQICLHLSETVKFGLFHNKILLQSEAHALVLWGAVNTIPWWAGGAVLTEEIQKLIEARSDKN